MFIVILIILGGLCSIIGYARGLKGTGEVIALFVLGVMLFPLGLIVAIVWPIKENDSIDCPQCAETIKKKANVCCWCGLDLWDGRRRGRKRG